MQYELVSRPILFQLCCDEEDSKVCSLLSKILEKNAPNLEGWPEDLVYVLDGGYFLHQVVWPKPATDEQVILACFFYSGQLRLKSNRCF